MWEVLLSIVVVSLAISGLAVGVIFSNRSLKGSCGGLGAMTDEQGHSLCMTCTTPKETCRRELAERIAAGESEDELREAAETHST